MLQRDKMANADSVWLWRQKFGAAPSATTGCWGLALHTFRTAPRTWVLRLYKDFTRSHVEAGEFATNFPNLTRQLTPYPAHDIISTCLSTHFIHPILTSLVPTMTGRSRRSAALKAREAIAADSSDIMSRARRDPDTSSRATLSRDPPSSPSNPSLRLTVKMPVSKLRAATGGSSRAGGRSSSGGRERFAGGEILESKRSRNVKKSYVVESESEEEDEEMEDLGDEDEDAEAESAEDDMDLDEDAEGEEDADGDEDTEMAVLPPPILKISKPTKEKHSITVKTAKKDVRVVATTDPSDDEELSDLESDVEEDEETMQVANDEDAEGDDEEIEVEVEVEEEEEEEEEEDELDSDDETPGGGSRGSTPDLSKLTKRQRARLDEGGSGHLLALPDGPSQKAPHSGRTRHAPRRNGTSPQEPQRKAQ
ncbi:hypothetical protein V502_04942 [Pseudogymnoascus sp. VKM F-4520 (FW-2644)]|nr:hypothetical protein V502_04942 [Pseudogymnoascus sp. VKM F-4520 (FW-2644)]